MPDSSRFALDVNPLRGQVGDAEWDARINLAAAFRAAYHLGWNETVNNHISLRVPNEPDHYLMNPAGFMWNEVTASSLIKAHVNGDILSATNYDLAPAGKNFHSAIMDQRRDLACTIHIHPVSAVAVSASKDGLKFYDQTACALYGMVGNHDFEGMVHEKSESERILEDLGDGYALLMKNHGLLTIGRSIGEAFAYMHRFVMACNTQVAVLSMGVPHHEIPKEVCEKTHAQMRNRRRDEFYGERMWPAYVRLADRLDPSYRE